MTIILTMNIQGYAKKHGARADRRRLIEGATRQPQLDLVALQAVSLDPEQAPTDQARQLAHNLPGSQSVFVPARTPADGEQEVLPVLEGAAVVAGAFDVQPDNLGLGRLREAEWVDAWTLLRSGEPGSPLWRAAGPASTSTMSGRAAYRRRGSAAYSPGAS